MLLWVKLLNVRNTLMQTKLRVTKVNVGGDRLLDIVCGAPNCRQGLKVACATEGAVLPGDFKIKKD